MLAAVLRGPKQLDITEVGTPEPGEGEILLKVGANTDCGTDLRILRGEKTAGVRPGVVLGHEIAGTIAALGKGVAGYRVGDAAVVTPAVSCGTCFYCLRDREQLCDNTDIFGYNIDGGLAEYCLAYLTAAVTVRQEDGKREPLQTISGLDLTDLAQVRPAEIEQIITGTEDPEAARRQVQTGLVAARSIIQRSCSGKGLRCTRIK